MSQSPAPDALPLTDAQKRALSLLATQCYYRDGRVMISLRMEPRPPHPLGFDVEPGDWSLLDPVRARAALYRPAK